MRLATAFVEISVRMDSYRKQLQAAQEMASAAAGAISRSLHGAVELNVGSPTRSRPQFPKPTVAPRPGVSGERRTLDSRSQESIPHSRRGEPNSLAPANPGFPFARAAVNAPAAFGLREQRDRPAVGPTGAGSVALSGGEEKALLREQVELGKKELAILNKQLKALQEVREGIPAVLT